MILYYCTVFLGAFLLFLIQPMLTKALLPGFGGSYLVWGASMVFYQGILLVGYLLSHHLQRWLGVVRYARWHWFLLLAPFLVCPFHFDEIGSNTTGMPLALGVFVILFCVVSLPFLTLSMTSLILQRWVSVSNRAVNPYVLYSASNLGSIMALVLYPTLIEPFSSLQQQGQYWWWGYAALVLLHLLCMPRAKNIVDLEKGPAADAVAPLARKAVLEWLLLSMAACAMLLAVTNVLTLDVASIPFLWVLPLATYLLAFVVTFKKRIWFPDWIQKGLYWALIPAVGMQLMSQLRQSLPVGVSIVLHLVILFVVAVNCSGWLVRRQPEDDEHLTSFYVVIAVGGLLGSLVVSWVIPLLSSSLIEYLLALALTFAAVGIADDNASGPISWKRFLLDAVLMACAVTVLPLLLGTHLPPEFLLLAIILPVVLLLRYRAGDAMYTAWLLLVLMVASCWTEQLAVRAQGVTRLRNYYGIYKIYDRDGIRYLEHGTTQHGRQYLAGPKRNVPLAYFHPSTPAANVLTCSDLRLNDIGMIGLGTGALATYASNGQHFTIYEIDPDNKDIAEQKFGYINYARQRGAVVDYVFGDGRVALRDCADNSYDVFILDAFSSGAIPVHLLTTQAFEEYMRVLRPDGILLLHVSNKMLDLLPVVYSNADSLGLFVCEQNNEAKPDPDAERTYWAALTRDPKQFELLLGKLDWWQRSSLKLPAPWTDQYSNVLQAMMLWH